VNDLRFFLKYAWRHKNSYALGTVALFVSNWLVVNIPEHIGKSIDLLGEGVAANYQQLLPHIYAVVGFALLMIVSRTLSRMLFFNPGRDLEREFKNDTFSKLTALQKDFYSQHQTGALISIMNNDITGVRAMAGIGMMQVVNIAFALSLTPAKMWLISPSLMIYCIGPIIVAFIIVNYSIVIMRELMKTRMLALQELSANTVHFLSGVDVIKGHHIYDWAVSEFERDNKYLLDVSLKQLRIRTFFLPILEYTDGVLKILILAVGGSYLIDQQLSLGELTAFLSYATLLAMPFISFGRIISVFQMGMVSLRSIRRILDQPLQAFAALEEGGGKALFSRGISVKNLNFSYPAVAGADSTPVLKNISFNIEPGQRLALLGKVGSGKTTLVNCLNGYLPIAQDQIFIDDHDISTLARQDLRMAIRTITQEPFLFSDTIRSNIEFGAAGSSERLSIEQALYQSDMLAEVKGFPEREQTLVGEKGILLSGGQKQRLSLSRGLFTPSKLIVLDNVLSAVDNETERFLLAQIFEEVRSESSLIVSHRPEVLERVDQILLLEDGEIIARGHHRELLQSSAIYRDTWSLLQRDEPQQEAETLVDSGEVQHDS